MEGNSKKVFKRTIVVLVCVALAFGITASVVLKMNVIDFLMFQISLGYDDLSAYNNVLPQNKVACPYSLKNYHSEYLYSWGFKDLNVKIKEHNINEDYWASDGNFDIIFCSDGKKYVRNGINFSSEITPEKVEKIYFAEHGVPLDFFSSDNCPGSMIIPDLNDAETAMLTEIVTGDEYSLDEVGVTSYFNDMNTAWYIIYDLRQTGDVNYSGICAADEQRYYLMYDNEKMYLRDLNGRLKELPSEIAEKIVGSEILN